MTTETETAQADTRQDQADSEAAFAASFDGKEAPAPTKAADATTPTDDATQAAASAAPETTAQAADPKAASTEQQAADPAATTTPEAASTTPSPTAAENAELRAEMRRLHGRFGALHDELKQLKTSKEAEGKPAVATQVELTRLKAEYPELADVLIEDLGKALGGLAGKASDPKEVETLVTQRVQEGIARAAASMRESAVSDAHPTWQTDLFTQDATGQKKPTADYLAWRAAIGEDEAKAFEASTNPYQVIRKLTGFYEWKKKSSEAEATKQQRLKAALTPQGVPRVGSQTISDEEALRKGFEEGFNS